MWDFAWQIINSIFSFQIRSHNFEWGKKKFATKYQYRLFDSIIYLIEIFYELTKGVVTGLEMAYGDLQASLRLNLQDPGYLSVGTSNAAALWGVYRQSWNLHHVRSNCGHL